MIISESATAVAVVIAVGRIGRSVAPCSPRWIVERKQQAAEPQLPPTTSKATRRNPLSAIHRRRKGTMPTPDNSARNAAPARPSVHCGRCSSSRQLSPFSAPGCPPGTALVQLFIFFSWATTLPLVFIILTLRVAVSVSLYRGAIGISAALDCRHHVGRRNPDLPHQTIVIFPAVRPTCWRLSCSAQFSVLSLAATQWWPCFSA